MDCARFAFAGDHDSQDHRALDFRDTRCISVRRGLTNENSLAFRHRPGLLLGRRALPVAAPVCERNEGPPRQQVLRLFCFAQPGNLVQITKFALALV